MDNGVLLVRDTPIITTSAFSKPDGFLPSSYLTANSIASTFLKYSWSSLCTIPAVMRGLVEATVPTASNTGPIISTAGI